MVIMRMLEWYFGFRPLARLALALVVIGIGVYGLIDANGRLRRDGRAGIVAAVGIVLLLCSFPTRGERSEWGDS